MRKKSLKMAPRPKRRRSGRRTRSFLRGGNSDEEEFTPLEQMFMAIDSDYILEFHGSRFYPDGLLENDIQFLSTLLVNHRTKINELSPSHEYDRGEYGTLLHRAVTIPTGQTHTRFLPSVYDRPDCDYSARQLEKVSMLLGVEGIDVNLRDNWNRTPLIATRSVKCVKLLLEHPGIDINAVDEDGRTALWHAAAQGGYDQFTIRYERKTYLEKDALEIASMLIRAGADETIADTINGRTPMDVAKYIGFTSYENLITQLIHEHNVTQMNGLHGLAKNKFLETIKKTPNYYKMSSFDKKRLGFYLRDKNFMVKTRRRKKGEEDEKKV